LPGRQALAASPDTAPEAGAPAATSAPGREALTAQALEHYRRAIAAQRAGNWALYGEELAKLGKVLEQLTEVR
jgi:uncharacterized membrane protein (UPF0182 family)